MTKDQAYIIAGTRETLTDSDFLTEKFKYKGLAPDSPEVVGVLTKPKSSKHRSLPLVIFNTSGTKKCGGHADQPNNYRIMESLGEKVGKASGGALVVSSSLRDKDEYGGYDVQDVLDIMEIGKQQPEWDGRNVIMIGVSRGAMMTYLAIRDGAIVV